MARGRALYARCVSNYGGMKIAPLVRDGGACRAFVYNAGETEVAVDREKG